MKTQYIVFGIVGVVILFLLSRLRSSEAQTIPEFVPPQTDELPSSAGGVSEAQLGALSALGSLTATKLQTDASLTATQIAADLQRAGIAANEQLGLRQIAARENLYLSDLGARDAEERMHLAAVERVIAGTRGLSTASVGMLLNQVGGVFNKPPAYSHDQTFGAKQEPWYAPITRGIGNGLSGFIGGIKLAGGV